MDARIRHIVGQLRRRLGALYRERLRRVIVYGSQARGDADAGSDIDVLVVLSGAVEPAEEISRSAEDVAALSLDHGVVLTCMYVSETEFDRAASPLLMNVRREGVAV